MLSKRKPIPVRNPEEIAIETKQRRGDDEKVATTSIKSLVVHEVELHSRSARLTSSK